MSVFIIGFLMVIVEAGLTGANFEGEKIARHLSDGKDPDKYLVLFIERLVHVVIVAVIFVYLITR